MFIKDKRQKHNKTVFLTISILLTVPGVEMACLSFKFIGALLKDIGIFPIKHTLGTTESLNTNWRTKILLEN